MQQTTSRGKNTDILEWCPQGSLVDEGQIPSCTMLGQAPSHKEQSVLCMKIGQAACLVLEIYVLSNILILHLTFFSLKTVDNKQQGRLTTNSRGEMYYDSEAVNFSSYYLSIFLLFYRLPSWQIHFFNYLTNFYLFVYCLQQQESNPRPHACQASSLSLTYISSTKTFIFKRKIFLFYPEF